MGKHFTIIAALLLLGGSCARQAATSQPAARKAALIFLDWPRPQEEPYPWPQNPDAWPPDFSGYEMLRDRWESGTRAPAGLANEERVIRALVLEHLQKPWQEMEGVFGMGTVSGADAVHLQAGAGTKQPAFPIRWLSANEVMLSVAWHSAHYYYIVQRHPDGWCILHRYMTGIA